MFELQTEFRELKANPDLYAFWTILAYFDGFASRIDSYPSKLQPLTTQFSRDVEVLRSAVVNCLSAAPRTLLTKPRTCT
jgi:hypothetical protein